MPTTGTAGTAITGVTDTLTPTTATAFACLYTAAADVGSRVAFTGTAVPALTPTTAASYTIRLYAAATGGVALAESAAIAVAAAAVARTVTFAGAAGAPSGAAALTVALDIPDAVMTQDGSGRLLLPTTGSHGGVFQSIGTVGDGTLTATYAAGTADTSISLLFRVSTPGTGYQGYKLQYEAAGSRWSVFKFVNGAYAGTIITSIDVVPTTSIGVRMVGNSITCMRDGGDTGLVVTYVTSILTGYVGVGNVPATTQTTITQVSVT